MAYPPFQIPNIKKGDPKELNETITHINRALMDIYRGTDYSPTKPASAVSKKHRGCLVYLDTDIPIANATDTIVDWDDEEYDTDTIHHPNNASRLTVPIGVTKIKLKAHTIWETNSTGTRAAIILKNGTDDYKGKTQRSTTDDQGRIELSSPVLIVEAGDYFELEVRQNSGGGLDLLQDDRTWFSMEIVE